MGLYLCVFDNDQEIEGVEVGAYSDFEHFRTAVTDGLEGGVAGSRFPVLILHSDSDGEWTVAECKALRNELVTISEHFRVLPPTPFGAEWQGHVASLVGLVPASLFESFIDVDGEFLLERLIGLCEVAVRINRPILFQ
jgi:hypothetical protein